MHLSQLPNNIINELIQWIFFALFVRHLWGIASCYSTSSDTTSAFFFSYFSHLAMNRVRLDARLNPRLCSKWPIFDFDERRFNGFILNAFGIALWFVLEWLFTIWMQSVFETWDDDIMKYCCFIFWSFLMRSFKWGWCNKSKRIVVDPGSGKTILRQFYTVKVSHRNSITAVDFFFLILIEFSFSKRGANKKLVY